MRGFLVLARSIHALQIVVRLRELAWLDCTATSVLPALAAAPQQQGWRAVKPVHPLAKFARLPV